MTPTPAKVQVALTFLVWLRSAEDKLGAFEALPASIDYEALAALARQSGHNVTATAVAEAFRILMRARALAKGRGGEPLQT